jgi:hypothetical protein
MAASTGMAIAASTGASLLGGIVGNMASAGDRSRAASAAQAAFDEINALGAPPDLSKKIILEHFKKAGVYTPKLEQEINAGFSKLEQVQEDPNLKDTQMGALRMLKDRAAGGMSAQDRADLNKIRQQVGTDTQGKLEAIRQQMAARGQGGSAEESAMGDRLAAQAQQAALQSAMQSGQLGGNIRTQDFDVARAKAEAADRFKLFDVQNAQARQQRNVDYENKGQLYNLSESQRLSDANIGMENTELLRQNQAKRAYWQDQADRARMRSAARTNQVAGFEKEADATAKQWQGIGSGVGSAITSYSQWAKDNPSKPDISKQVLPNESQDAYDVMPTTNKQRRGEEGF